MIVFIQGIIKTCVICNEEVDTNGEFAEFFKCYTIQLSPECKACHSASVHVEGCNGYNKAHMGS